MSPGLVRFEGNRDETPVGVGSDRRPLFGEERGVKERFLHLHEVERSVRRRARRVLAILVSMLAVADRACAQWPLRLMRGGVGGPAHTRRARGV